MSVRPRLAGATALEQRFRGEQPIFGLPPEVPGWRWVSVEGVPDDLVLAHGEPRPDSSPLVTIGTMRTRFDESSWVDVHARWGRSLMLSERSRNDPAFQYATRDEAAIERELAAVSGRDAWRPFEIEIDGVPKPFQRQDRAGDWIAFHDLGDECLYVHFEQPDG